MIGVTYTSNRHGWCALSCLDLLRDISKEEGMSRNSVYKETE